MPSRGAIALAIAVALQHFVAAPAEAVVAALNGKILYVDDSANAQQVWVYDTVDRSRTPLVEGVEDGRNMRASWSPDGKRIAFNKGTYSDSKIFVMASDGTGVTQLTTGTLQGQSPTWSPDGTQIAFIGGNDFSSRAVWVMQSTGGSPRQVTPGDGFEEFNAGGDSGCVSWSPDGRLLTFSASADASESDDIYTIRPDGSGLVRVTQTGADCPSWSPDGRSIAYSYGLDVHLMASDASEDRIVTEGIRPSWSPEGDWLLVRDAGGVKVVNVETGDDAGNLSPNAIMADWQPTNLKRIAGTDRIETSISISASTYDAGQASAAVLARSDNYPDALAGVPLALKRNGPMLLTGSDALDDRVNTELQFVLPRGRTVYMLGGTGALSENIADQLRNLGYAVVRYGGVNRFDTARIITEEGLGSPATILLANGLGFQEPLIAGAAAPAVDGGLLLTAGTEMAGETEAYLAAHPGATRYAIGGAAATADPSATRLAGSSYAETSAIVARRFFTSSAYIGVASDQNFPDALSGGPHIAGLGGPLLLTNPYEASTPVLSYLSSQSADLGFLYGGKAAVEDSVREAMSNAMRP